MATLVLAYIRDSGDTHSIGNEVNDTENDALLPRTLEAMPCFLYKGGVH